ncbi:MAG: flagellar basal body L-ring protein FlgH [Deltaproteobacteria bacterium]|nr:flagellar basal body L-ring protein FlgH [Deltaproteobacteria bacterium]
MKIHFIGLSLLALLCSCSFYGTRPDAIQPQAKTLPVPIVKPDHSPGSLWPGESGRNMLFTDNKARYVNDIVTIIIDESSSGQNQASTSTSKNSASNSDISAMLGLDTSIKNANSNLGGKLSVGGTSASTLKGAGDTSRGGKLQARLTARVVKVLDNGNLLIEGRRQLTLNAEDQFIVITGVIRSEDIMADNWVLSSNMADARILYTGSGVLTDKQHPGWMTRALDWGWPF